MKQIQHFDFLAKLISVLLQKDRILFFDPSKRRTTQYNPAWNHEVNALLEKYPQMENLTAVYMYGIEKAVVDVVMTWAERQQFFTLLTLI